MCVWLGTLASWRPGFIRQLVLPVPDDGAGAGRSRRPRSPRSRCAAPRRGAATAGARRRSASRDAGGASLRRRALRRCARRRARSPVCGALSSRPPGDLVVAWTDALYPDQLRDLVDPPLCLFVRGGADAATARPALRDRRRAARRRGRHARAVALRRGDGAHHRRRPGARRHRGRQRHGAWAIDAIAQNAAVDAAGAAEPGDRRGARLRRGRRVSAHATRGSMRGSRGAASSSASSPGASRRARWRFPARNRVMAALGRAVVLVEGAERSGAQDHRRVRRRARPRGAVRARRGRAQAEPGAEPAAPGRRAGLRERRGRARGDRAWRTRAGVSACAPAPPLPA